MAATLGGCKVNRVNRSPLFIALVGAESTGKTALALALATHWQTMGVSVAVIPEVLREWCAQAGRTPQPHEQLPIAQEQARRTLTAAADVVIADTTPLMTAIYSHMLFRDESIYGFALAHHRIYQHTLLTGLDLPWVADGIQRDSPAVQAPVDALVRHALSSVGIGYHVIYGKKETRQQNALRAMKVQSSSKTIAISAQLVSTEGINRSEKTENALPWVWHCDKCSDPVCEHRLFTGLL